MTCCVCNGSCMHVGPHSFCASHDGGGVVGFGHPVVVGTDTTFTFTPPPCDHCFCVKDAFALNGEGPHRQCCKCNTVMAEEFIATAVPDPS